MHNNTRTLLYIHCMMTPVIPLSGWWNHSSHAVHDDTLIASLAWWYPSTQASHDDTQSSHALHDDITHHKQCMMIPTISRDAWLNHSSQALYITIPDITYHHIRCLMISDHRIDCLMIPFISSCAWWSLSSQWLHDDTHQHKNRMTETMVIPIITTLHEPVLSSQPCMI